MKHRDNRADWLDYIPLKDTDRYAIIDGLGRQVGPGYPTLEEAETVLGLSEDPARYMVAPLLF